MFFVSTIVWAIGVIFNVAYNALTPACQTTNKPNVNLGFADACPATAFLACGFISEVGIMAGAIFYDIMLLLRYV